MDTKIVSSFAQHQTAKAIWDSLAVTYGTTVDPLQTYDLEVKANKVTQSNKSIENFWAELQGIWLSINRRDPNPLKCYEEGIRVYRTIVAQKRLFQFLSGLNPKFEGVRKDLLKEVPLPSPEVAFSRVRQEAARSKILQPSPPPQPELPNTEIGVGLAGKGNTNQRNPPNRGKPDKLKMVCSHCGMRKHTKEQCFQLIGYPEWWSEDHRSAATGKGKIAVGGARPTPSPGVEGSSDSIGVGFGGYGGARRPETSTNGGKPKAAEGHSDEGDYWA